MELVSWNIQHARGVDGHIDPARIVADARRTGEFDVLCLQEVACGFPALTGGNGDDQFARFAALMPGFHAAWVTPVDLCDQNGQPQRFGNMILSRHPIVRTLRHQLPWPASPLGATMPRAMLDVTINLPDGPLRVLTTQLERHSSEHRGSQIEAIRALYAEHCLRTLHSPDLGDPGSTYHMAPQTTRTVLAGDFHFRPDDPLYTRLQMPFEAPGVPRLTDAWRICHGDRPHAYSVGLHEHIKWPLPFTCDYVLVSGDLANRVMDLRVDGRTRASDHQPLRIVLS